MTPAEVFIPGNPVRTVREDGEPMSIEQFGWDRGLKKWVWINEVKGKKDGLFVVYEPGMEQGKTEYHAGDPPIELCNGGTITAIT